MGPPNDVLQESRSTQDLFKRTAGNRPPQPEEDRAHFEMLWRQNFILSKVDYKVPKEVLMAGTPISSSAFEDSHFAGDSRELSNYGNLATDTIATDAEVAEAIERLHAGREGPRRIAHEVVNKQIKGTGSEDAMTILIRGDNVFGTTVSKSFDRVNKLGNREVDTVTISIAGYRVVEVSASTHCGLNSFSLWMQHNQRNECRLRYNSPRRRASLPNFLLSTVKEVFEIQLVFGSDIPILRHSATR